MRYVYLSARLSFFRLVVRALTLFAISVLLTMPASLAAQEIAILVYHRFSPNVPGSTTVRTSTFISQLDWLATHRYHVVRLSNALPYLCEDRRMPETRSVVITVDDGHESVYTQLFPIILKDHLPVTLFIYPSAISHASYALTWTQLATMMRSGLVDVESHTYWHPNFDHERARLAPAQYRAFVDFQLQESKKILQTKLGVKVDLLAWPYGIYNPYLEHAAQQAGYSAAFAFSGGTVRAGCDRFAIPRIPVSDADRNERFGALLTSEHSKRSARRE